MDKMREQLYSQLNKAIAAPYVEKLAEANAKLEAIRKALPDYRIMGNWQPGARAFVRTVQMVLEVRKEVEH